MKPPTMAWAFPYKSLIKKMTYRIVFSLSDRGVFSIGFLYRDNPSLCQVNVQLIRTKSTQNFYFFSLRLSVHNMHMHECDCMGVNTVVCELQVLQFQKKSVLTCQDVRLSLKVLQLWRKGYPNLLGSPDMPTSVIDIELKVS